MFTKDELNKMTILPQLKRLYKFYFPERSFYGRNKAELVRDIYEASKEEVPATSGNGNLPEMSVRVRRIYEQNKENG